MTLPKVNQQPFYLKLALVLIAIIALGYIGIAGKKILSPLIFSLLFSLLLLPVANFFEKKLKFHRSAAAALSVLLLLLAVTAIVIVVGTQISGLVEDWPMLKEQIIKSFDHFQHWISKTFHVNVAKQMDYVDSATSKIASASPTVIGATVISVSSELLFLIFTIFYTFFLLFYRKLLLKFLLDVFKEKNSGIVYDIVSSVRIIIRQYVLGLFFEMLTVATACCFVFLLLGIKYAILLGIITALFNIIPYIGIFTALLLNVIITVATTAATSKVLFVIITVVSMHLVDSNILLPLIVGSKVRINAFITLLAVVAGEMIWGIAGMFLAIPVIAIFKIIFDRVDTLKPWGELLGQINDLPANNPFKRKMKMRNKVVNNSL